MFDGLGLNLLSEALGVAAELTVVYFLVDNLLKKHEKARWLPARSVIVKHLARVYSRVTNAAYHSMRLDFHDQAESCGDQNYEMRQIFLKQIQIELDKFVRVVDLNNAALDSTLMPQVTVFTENAERAFDKLKYFIQYYAPGCQKYDFVSQPPFEELGTIRGIVNELQK